MGMFKKPLTLWLWKYKESIYLLKKFFLLIPYGFWNLSFFFFFFPFVFISWRLITLQYCSGFCHILTWISHGFTCVPHPEPPSHFSPHPIPLGHPSAPALSTLSHALKQDWQSVSHIIIYMVQCHSPKSFHPRPHPQSPKDGSIHLCLLLSCI